jgi:hypothetical protein
MNLLAVLPLPLTFMTANCYENILPLQVFVNALIGRFNANIKDSTYYFYMTMYEFFITLRQVGTVRYNGQ